MWLFCGDTKLRGGNNGSHPSRRGDWGNASPQPVEGKGCERVTWMNFWGRGRWGWWGASDCAGKYIGKLLMQAAPRAKTPNWNVPWISFERSYLSAQRIWRRNRTVPHFLVGGFGGSQDSCPPLMSLTRLSQTGPGATSKGVQVEHTGPLPTKQTKQKIGWRKLGECKKKSNSRMSKIATNRETDSARTRGGAGQLPPRRPIQWVRLGGGQWIMASPWMEGNIPGGKWGTNNSPCLFHGEKISKEDRQAKGPLPGAHSSGRGQRHGGEGGRHLWDILQDGGLLGCSVKNEWIWWQTYHGGNHNTGGPNVLKKGGGNDMIWLVRQSFKFRRNRCPKTFFSSKKTEQCEIHHPVIHHKRQNTKKVTCAWMVVFSVTPFGNSGGPWNAALL